MVKAWLTAALGSIFLMGSTTGAGMHEKDRRPMNERPASTSRPMASSSRAMKDVDIACVGAAVAARETSLSSAAATQNQAVATAYAARAAALNTAYAGTDAQAVKESVKKAWEDFSKATKGAKQTWQRSKENSWKTFKDAVKACKGAEAITDTSSVSMEQ